MKKEVRVLVVLVLFGLITTFLVFNKKREHDDSRMSYAVDIIPDVYSLEDTPQENDYVIDENYADIERQLSSSPPPPIQANVSVSDVKKILLYTYMRGGSSFIGEIFKQNREAIYWFEHLDGFYQTEFGMSPNVKPINIIYFTNKTKRIPTEEEAVAIAHYHKSIFNCDYNAASLDLFTDLHNIRHSTMYFGRCGFYPGTSKPCRELVSTVCTHNPEKLKVFARNIELSESNHCFQTFQMLKSTSHWPEDDGRLDQYKKYIKCYEENKIKFKSQCAKYVSRCENAKLQAAKAIRLTMELVEESLITIPDMYFLYYVRDPRGTICSRLSHRSLLTYSVMDELKLLCDRMLHDYTVFIELKTKYPDRVMMVKYEDLAIRPANVTQDIYTFIGETVPYTVSLWLKRATYSKTQKTGTFTHMRSNSSEVAISWRKRLTSEQIKDMTDTCKTVLNKLNYPE